MPVNSTLVEDAGYREKAAAACETINRLIELGADVPIATRVDSTKAHKIVHGLLRDYEPLDIANTPPEVMLKLDALLTAYDYEFVNASVRFQNYITNRLLEESNTSDPKSRLRALELLGKCRGINLFSDRVEVTVKQKTTEDLEARISVLLGIRQEQQEIEDAEEVEDEAGETDEIGAVEGGGAVADEAVEVEAIEGEAAGS